MNSVCNEVLPTRLQLLLVIVPGSLITQNSSCLMISSFLRSGWMTYQASDVASDEVNELSDMSLQAMARELEDLKEAALEMAEAIAREQEKTRQHPSAWCLSI